MDTPVMRDNPVKATLASGGYAFGAMIFELFAPGIPQICRNAGADFVLYDMEHTGLSFETLKTQFALCRGLRIVPMVRVPRGEYHFIARALDVGAMGVMVPMVGTPEEAAHIVGRGIRHGAPRCPFAGAEMGGIILEITRVGSKRVGSGAALGGEHVQEQRDQAGVGIASGTGHRARSTRLRKLVGRDRDGDFARLRDEPIGQHEHPAIGQPAQQAHHNEKSEKAWHRAAPRTE